MKIRCIECNGKTTHLILQSIEASCSELINQQFSVEWLDDYEIVQCQGCESITFRHLNWFSEDPDELSERLYPKRSENSHSTKLYPYASPSLKRIYRETV